MNDWPLKRSALPGARSMKPCYSTYYRIGTEFQNQLTPWRPMREVGAALGLSQQNAHTFTMIALGKVIYRLWRSCQ
jgi:hypothetical protein